MKLSLSLLAVATVLASEALALSGSHDNPTSHDLIRRHHRNGKRGGTCKPKKNSTGSGKTDTGSDSGSSSGSSSGGDLTAGPKVGLAWTYGTYMDITKFIGKGKASFYYDWKSGGQGAAGPNAPAYWPMLWGGDGGRVNDWQKNVLNNPNKITSKVVMGPNEPEIPSQSNMSPQAACDLMRKYVMPLKSKGFRVVGPAIVTLEGPWYGNFKKACPDVHEKIDALPVHIYAGLAGPAIAQMERYHQAHGKPLLITEMACHSFYVTDKNPVCKDAGQAAQFMQQISAWAKKTDWMLSVAPFGLFKDSLPDGLAAFNKLSDSNGNPTWMWETFVKAI